MKVLLFVGLVLSVLGMVWAAMGNSIGLAVATAGVASVGAAAIFQLRALGQTADSLEASQAKLGVLNHEILAQRDSIDSLAEGLDAALMICDSRGAIEYANLQARRLFRTDSPEGKFLLAITLSHEIEELVQQVASSGMPQVAELSFNYPTAQVGLIKAWPSPGERVFLTIFEITELRKLERIRKDFVANVSHEMRTPMTIIRAMAETLLDEDDNDLKDRYLTKIISEVDRLSTISQDLLVLSTAESSQVRKQDCDVAAIVSGIVAQLTPKAKEKGIELTYSGPAKLVMNANSTQMSQVALNLIENGINYTAAGTVSASLREEGNEVVFEVRDSGMGIASEYLGRIFERFYRIDRARSRSSGGTGLGLSIVKHIAESHGGTVTVDSALNEGSTFTVRLPKD